MIQIAGKVCDYSSDDNDSDLPPKAIIDKAFDLEDEEDDETDVERPKVLRLNSAFADQEDDIQSNEDEMVHDEESATHVSEERIIKTSKELTQEILTTPDKPSKPKIVMDEVCENLFTFDEPRKNLDDALNDCCIENKASLSPETPQLSLQFMYINDEQIEENNDMKIMKGLENSEDDEFGFSIPIFHSNFN